MKIIDTIICAKTIISIDKNDTIFNDYSLIIDKGKIIDILPNSNIDKYQADNIIHRQLLIPGLINAHTHSPMNLFKGLACDKPLDIWLKDYIWPAEAKFVNRDFVKTGTQCAIAEMIKSGITCFNDMYFFADETAKICEKIGMRFGMGLFFLDFPTVWAENNLEYLQKATKLYERYKNNSLVQPILAPHSIYAVADKTLQKVLQLSNKFQIPIHIHLHETKNEIAESLKTSGIRPIERLNKLGLLNENLIAAHMVHLTNDEKLQIKTTKTNIVHCPKSNLKLGSGIADIKSLDEYGINIAIGTDSSASNNNLDMFSEMQYAALLAKGTNLDAEAIGAYKTLKMATINGAKAIGLADKIGSLEIGKAADIVALDINDISCQPWFDVVTQLIYSASKDQVSDVWIAGKRVLCNKKLVQLNENDLLEDIKRWQNKFNK